MASELSHLSRGDSYRLATSARSTNGKSLPRQYRENVKDLKQELDMNEHRIPIDELYEALGTDPDNGLTEEDAKIRLRDGNPNILSPVYSTPDSILFCKSLFGGFNLLLWIGGILSFIAFGIQMGMYNTSVLPMNNLYMAIVLIVIAILSAIFLFIQERKSMRIIESFEKMVPYQATVIRNGFTYKIPAELLVVGDIVFVKCGDRIPADIRIISATSFKVDNSALTGESDAQVRSPDYTNENSLETKNLAFYSTNAVEGSCKGVVINTGDSTVIGRIANLASGLEMRMTPIAKEINRFIYIIFGISIIISVSFIIAAFLLGYFWIDSIMLFIAIIIACIPEGLLATVTICLTLTAQRMGKKHCLVKHLEAVETLGSTKVICCDKTGTLTQNKMTVVNVFFDEELHEIEIDGNELVTKNELTSPTWSLLQRDAMLCNHSEFLPDSDNSDQQSYIINRKCTGDSSEAAILRFTEAAVNNVDRYRARNPKVFEMPFNSLNKYQITIHETEDHDPKYLMVIKGAPEKLLEMCSTIYLEGTIYNITNEWINTINKQYSDLGNMGERVIAFAETRLNDKQFYKGFDFEEEIKSIPLTNLTFIGMVSMKDPPRPAVPEAIKKCRDAGIKVIMMTGDHPLTAKAIARDVGIISEYSKTVEDLALERGLPLDAIDPKEAKACVIHGNELSNMSSNELDTVLTEHTEIVFARTTPQQKVLIVDSCQRLGYVVAVTGDGVNDSPALKKADIGIAMGLSGSDVSKQAADMILADDNFASIVDGIEEGRLIFDNLKKSICYTLTSNIPEIAAFLLFFILHIPLPLGTITVLLIDLGTDVLPAISLAYEPAESDIMQRPPRNPRADRLVSPQLLSLAYAQNGLIEAAAGFFAYFIVMTENGFWPQRLIGLRQEWDSPAINDVSDSYGQEWSYKQRKMLEYTSHAAFFVAIVMTQWINLMMCKTHRNSIFRQGMWNHYLTVSLAISAALALIFVYVPGLNVGLRIQPLRFTWWLPALPYMLVIFVYNEVRKSVLRHLEKPKKTKGDLIYDYVDEI